ncbi:PREDICTED: uncharacterized protein LOC109233223 [Nicotiana attenuata]|uniref:Oxidative stress 3 n=1 Tax=Nicotiana attenuata TaxID=49451 RepID=A0A1J6IBI4_NICAT|nr:PREDICTED: uncharacterized protein LOC109233223 [Nicotiana attenuata]OIS97879.1 hypothetical protein A4A49_08723 [Nicotiana attenuata]
MGLKEKNGGNQMNNVETWVIMETENCISDDYSLHSNSSESLSSSFELDDDASSHGPLYELSELMDHLPIKRGLSKYYQGNSRSFGCLASVKSLEDLAKKGNSYNQRMKSFKSFGLDVKRSSFRPKATIKKKSYSSSSRRPILSNTTLHVANCTSPISLEKNF